MKCPYCQSDNDRVIDSRASEDGSAIRRRRSCLKCNGRFTTYERIEAPIKVVKKDGSRTPYDRAKLRGGLEKACWKRPISERQLEDVIAKIEADMQAAFDTEVDSGYLGELVMRQLRSLDQVAYVRYASVYRQFKDAQDFVDEIRPMLSDSDDPDAQS